MLPWPFSSISSASFFVPKRVRVTLTLDPAGWLEERRRAWAVRHGDDPKEQAARKEELERYIFCDRWADN